ncbi:hypothetical protein [Paraburkholderia nodosa]|uniref:hypothetical protein n=1 Tax=Paraburkholderia nodosa TaxID=392320 RepID=UPI0012B68708|nr:hypothetical protein [Paraburkholderia nodosa]
MHESGDNHLDSLRPRGGPDGGRDIEALFRTSELAYGAVGFVNQAADVDEKKRKIRSKFADDLQSAYAADPRPSVFVFFTNVNFTIGEKAELITQAQQTGFSACEIFDRERLRIALDSPDGFAARFQYLGLPMSEAEQASFFAKWGDDIQSVIATGFQEVHATLAQLLFLQEASQPVDALTVRLQLDREYSADEIGHFRAFSSVYLREPKLGILGLLFGRTDRANRFRTGVEPRPEDRSGIGHGIASGQWYTPWHIEPDAKEQGFDGKEQEKYVACGSGSGVGTNAVKQLMFAYATPSFIRPEPVLALIDFDHCMMMPFLNERLSDKINRISIFANGYMLLDIYKDAFHIDRSTINFGLDREFSATELADPWVRIRPNNASAFRLSFADQVPVRMFKSKPASSE